MALATRWLRAQAAVALAASDNRAREKTAVNRCAGCLQGCCVPPRHSPYRLRSHRRVPGCRARRISNVEVQESRADCLYLALQTVKEVPFYINKYNTVTFGQRGKAPGNQDALGFAGAGRCDHCTVTQKVLRLGRNNSEPTRPRGCR